jgi:hypothetical protein
VTVNGKEENMIELYHDGLAFSFPEVHPKAKLNINFQRTLRIPDDGKDYPLPPGLGKFPLRHVDDFADHVPEAWVEHGGVMLPMYQSEALWINFVGHYVDWHDTSYPFAVKIGTGKINALTGDSWSDSLHKRPQNYLVTSRQPWLDGYCVEKGLIRQFVAMPLGAGYSAEEQLTGVGQYGGIQIVVYPMKRQVFESRFPERFVLYQKIGICASEMGLAPGGKMRQEIYSDPFDLTDWDLANSSRCFVHITNSMLWRALTGEMPPTVPFTAKEYNDSGLPWFEYFDDKAYLVPGSDKLTNLKSVVELGKIKADVPLSENETLIVNKIIKLRSGLKKNQVREGDF